jgi:TRAP-type C4-dicarboxylate transport system permease small subunit
MIVISVAITCQMIFVRFVLNQSTIWQTEAVIYLMIAATLLGLPYVQKLRGHVNVDLMPLHAAAAAARCWPSMTMVTSW